MGHSAIGRELRITAVDLCSYLLRLASSEMKPATVSEKETAEVPVDPGRGGSQHQTIQHRIKQSAELAGFRGVIEKEVLSGRIWSILISLRRRLSC